MCAVLAVLVYCYVGLNWEVHFWLTGAVAADVALVWANCRQFNSEGSEIAAMAAEAQAAFERRWAKEGLPALSSLGRASKRGRQEATAVKDEIAEGGKAQLFNCTIAWKLPLCKNRYQSEILAEAVTAPLMAAQVKCFV